MKKNRRILAIVLLFALLVSCLFLTTATAEGPFKAKGISDIEDILEYYALDNYVADDYEDGTWDADYYEGDNSVVVSDPANSANKVLEVTGKNNKYVKGDLSAESLVVSFEFFYDADMTGEYRVDLKTKNAAGVEDTTYNTMFLLSAKDGMFRNSVWNADINNGEGGFELQDYTGFAPAMDTWYKVVIFFNPAEGNYSFKISADGGNEWHSSEIFSMGSAEVVSNFVLRTYADSRGDKVEFYLDNVEVYCGTFERYPAEKNDITAQTIIDLGAMYNDESTSSADKVRIATVLDKLINEYKFVPADTTPNLNEVNAVIGDVAKYVTLAFAEEVIGRAAAIDKTLGYDARIKYIEESMYYVDSMPSDDELANMDGLSDSLEVIEAVKAARAAFAQEVLDCAAVATDSVNFVTKMSTYDPDNKNYDEYLKVFYGEINAIVNVDFTYNYTTDDGYGMAQAILDFEAFNVKYNKLNDAANEFIAGAQAMQEALEVINASAPKEEAYEEAFAKLSAGYLQADAVYNNGDIDENLDESTHALLLSLFAVYNNEDNRNFVLDQIAASESFLEVMKRASTATYYTAIKAELENAANYIDSARLKYPGVPEAIELYNTLTEELANSNKAASDYIEAVKAVVAATTFADKQAAIANALLLKETGDVTGIPGVKEANISLSEQMTAVENIISNSDVIKAIVEELANEKSLLAQRQLIARANQAILGYNQSLAALGGTLSIDGVPEAIEAIDGYTAKYVESVSAKNDAHAAATEIAVDVAASALGAENAYKAADVIKNYIG